MPVSEGPVKLWIEPTRHFVEVWNWQHKMMAHSGVRCLCWTVPKTSSAGPVAGWKMTLPKLPSGPCSWYAARTNTCQLQVISERLESPFVQSVLTWTNLNKSSPRRCLIGGVDDVWLGTVGTTLGALAVEICGWRFGGSSSALGSSTSVGSGSCAWTIASAWTMGGAFGSGCGGACWLLVWLWLKLQNRKFQLLTCKCRNYSAGIMFYLNFIVWCWTVKELCWTIVTDVKVQRTVLAKLFSH